MATTAQQIERLRQGQSVYALGCLGSTTRMLSLLTVPFSKAMSTISAADSTITCVDCNEPLRKHSQQNMKAAERLDEMVSDAFDYARENLIHAARELRALGSSLPEIQQFIVDHCADKQEKECERQQHGHEHVAVPGPVVVY